MNLIRQLFSYIYPITIEKTSSKHNPVLEVRIENGKYVLNADHANYSFGSLHKIFLKTFQQIKIGEREIKNVLLLGFGAGSVPELLFEKFNLNCHITAVEIDEKVIELAKKYFNIHRFKKLELICADAFQFVQQCNTTFELIVVDVFIDNKVPSQFESVEFLSALKKIMSSKSILLFNKIIQIENGKESFLNLQEKFKNIFGEYEMMNVLGNALVVVRKNVKQ